MRIKILKLLIVCCIRKKQNNFIIKQTNLATWHKMIGRKRWGGKKNINLRNSFPSQIHFFKI